MTEISRELLIDIIKQMGIGMNFSRSYPKGHPGLDPILSKILSFLKEIPQDHEQVALCLIENVILFEGQRFESDKLPIVKSISNIFNKLGVRSVSFDVNLDVNDLKAFFYTMASTLADLQDYGNISAILEAQGSERIKLNELEYGVVSTKGGKVKIDWEIFLKTLRASSILVSEEDTKKELVNFLTDVVGLRGEEPDELQAKMIINTLEKLSNLVVEKFGAESWGEYSLIFTRILATLSPNIKKRIVQIKTENKRLADLIKNILPTLSDETLIEIVMARTMAQEDQTVDPDVLEVLKKLTGPRLVNLLPQLKDKIPKKALEEVTLILSQATQMTQAEKKTEEFSREEMEKELRKYFPLLRDPSPVKQIKAIDDIIAFTLKLIELKRVELIKLVVDRFDSLSDMERDFSVFARSIDALRELYLKSKSVGLRDIFENISKRIGKHLLRGGKEFIERKKVIINMIGEIRDLNYVTELISILWEPGTFNEAREALIKFSNDAVEPLLGVLKDAEDRSVRMKILDVLLRMGDVVVPPTMKLLNDNDWYVRRNALYILGEIKVADAIEAMGKLVHDDHEQVEMEAISALGKIGSEKIRPYLIDALKSKYKSVILAAVHHLPRDDVKVVIPDLLKMLERKKRIPDKKEEEIRRNVIQTLGEVGDDYSIEGLMRIIKERSLIGSDLLLGTKEAAIEALGKFGTQKAKETLQELVVSGDAEVSAIAEGVFQRLEKELRKTVDSKQPQ